MKKVSKGKPITETAGSIESLLSSLRHAFYRAFPDTSDRVFWVNETWDDHMIISASDLPQNQYWWVGYTRTDGPEGPQVSFDAYDAWQLVQLDYVPAPPDATKSPISTPNTQPLESAKAKAKAKGKRIVDQAKGLVARITESAGETGKQLKTITVDEAMTSGKINRNKRIYPSEVTSAAIAELQSHIHESAGQGRAVLLNADGDPLIGESDHPQTRGANGPILNETVVAWKSATLNEETGAVSLTGTIVETARGRDLLALVEAGIPIGVSLRGYGTSQLIEVNGQQVEQVNELHITGFDVVMQPSFRNQAVIESLIPQQEKPAMDFAQFLKMLGENAELAAQAKVALGVQDVKEITEAQAKAFESTLRATLGIAPTEDLAKSLKEAMDARRELAESKRVAAINLAIDAATKDLPFGALNAQFVEAVKAETFAKAEDVAAFVDRKKIEYGKLAAELKLESIGFKKGAGASKVTVLGPVIETETGTPEYATPAFMIAERMLDARHGDGEFSKWNESKPVGPNQEFAAKLLKKFDESHGQKLREEFRSFQEASSTTDLVLPNAVNRAIIARAVPLLVATGIFRTGIMERKTDEWIYRSYTGEGNYTRTVTDEVVAVPASLGVELTLANRRLTEGSVVVTSNDGLTTYTENTHYVIDYANGLIWIPVGSTIGTSVNIKVDYGYTAIRRGEGAAIERAKIQHSSKTMTAAADRLATKITDEALKFGRAALGIDVATETLADLAFEVKRKIDGGIFSKALYATRKVASNASAAWSLGTANYLDAIKKIGQGRSVLANRFYPASFILMSEANADAIANWDGFTQAGSRADSNLDATGYVGRIKNLPVFKSTEFTDGAMLIGNTELAGYFVFSPMELKGPFQTMVDEGSGLQLAAAEEYYMQEYNATDAPIGEKGYLVPVGA